MGCVGMLVGEALVRAGEVEGRCGEEGACGCSSAARASWASKVATRGRVSLHVEHRIVRQSGALQQ